MEKSKIREIANNIMSNAEYMFDYDLMGFKFGSGESLLNFAVTSNDALKEVKKDEFELLKKALVEKINESIERDISYINSVNAKENRPDVVKRMMKEDKNKEIEEYKKFIKWVEVDFTFKMLQEYC